jgi:hypothetical protein
LLLPPATDSPKDPLPCLPAVVGPCLQGGAAVPGPSIISGRAWQLAPSYCQLPAAAVLRDRCAPQDPQARHQQRHGCAGSTAELSCKPGSSKRSYTGL